MKTLKITLFLAIIFCFTFSCSGDDDKETDLSCIEKMSKYSDIANAKALKYNNEAMTPENCRGYKKAIEEYLTQTEECPNNESIKEGYKFALRNLDCN